MNESVDRRVPKLLGKSTGREVRNIKVKRFRGLRRNRNQSLDSKFRMKVVTATISV